MELRQLRYFITIANTKNYSTAAKSLFVTQPTLSWNIQKLEEELNTQLFLQTDQGLKLTKPGELLYDEGQNIITSMDNVVDQIKQMNKQGNKMLKVGITVLFAIQYMEQIIKFTSVHPNVELTFIQRGSVDLQRKLAHKEIDIGLVSFPIYEPNIIIESLNTSHPDYSVDVVLPFDHPLAKNKSIKISDLKEHPICAFSTNYVLGKVIRERCQENGFEPNIIFTNDNWEVLLHNTLLTNGMTLMPRAFKRLSNFINLKWIPFDDKANDFQIGIARRKNEHLSDSAVQFINYMKQN
ncbi:LysR family transcriptional regulator [Virgibacillus soli]|uniref:LysR family transcriptional regulator n=1 Tax=Paracerasibacillus soli TaxID=480284 RepID=A0ABU5CU07_9BACI|nr:LysR family transcriptional regulator [Virgibacillus soli]MDY0409332.1 LysR family transcriptional regulator [Virgibacillus soli]